MPAAGVEYLCDATGRSPNAVRRGLRTVAAAGTAGESGVYSSCAAALRPRNAAGEYVPAGAEPRSELLRSSSASGAAIGLQHLQQLQVGNLAGRVVVDRAAVLGLVDRAVAVGVVAGGRARQRARRPGLQGRVDTDAKLSLIVLPSASRAVTVTVAAPAATPVRVRIEESEATVTVTTASASEDAVIVSASESASLNAPARDTSWLPSSSRLRSLRAEAAVGAASRSAPARW